MFLACIATTVAAWWEVSLAVAAFSSPSTMTVVPRIIIVLQATAATELAVYMNVTLVVLFWQAASLTSACVGVTARAHKMVGFLEHAGDDNSVLKGKAFLDHIERGERRFGFRSMGITISKSLIVKSMYLIGTLLSTGLLVLLRYTNIGGVDIDGFEVGIAEGDVANNTST